MFIVPPLLSTRQHEQIIAFIKFAATTGLKHIVNLSQMGSDEIKDLPLRKGEIYIESCGIPYTHLRPNWFSQNFNTLHMAGIMEKGSTTAGLALNSNYKIELNRTFIVPPHCSPT